MAAIQVQDDDPYFDTSEQVTPLPVSPTPETLGFNDNRPYGYPGTDSGGLKTEQDFRNALGSLYDPSTYQSYLSNVSNNGGGDPNDWFNRIVAKESLRGTNEPSSQYTANNQGGFTTGPTGRTNYPSQAITAAQRAGTQIPMPGNQFSDPYTAMLESIAKSQIAQYQQPLNTAPYQQFQDFITKRFNELTQNPGYSPAELALLRTQSAEPIEQYRSASKQRSLEKAARAGYLPTSGITDLTANPSGGLEPLDVSYDRMRAAADRDLTINALNRRTQDLNSALNLGQLGVQLPEQQFAAQQNRNQLALQLATLLQQLPAQAQAEALAIINGTGSPQSILPYVNQMAYQNQQRNAQLWGSLGSLAALLGL